MGKKIHVNICKTNLVDYITSNMDGGYVNMFCYCDFKTAKNMTDVVEKIFIES